MTLKDETGQITEVKAGDVFFIREGSTITFSSVTSGLALKTGIRFPLGGVNGV